MLGGASPVHAEAMRALTAASDVSAGTDLTTATSFMVMDNALLWATSSGAAPTGVVCVRHPRAGLMSEEAFSDHTHRHGGISTCSTCGSGVGFREVRVPLGLGASRVGYRCITLPSQATYAWRGPVEVRGAGLCVDCWLTHVAGEVPIPLVHERPTA